MSNTWWKDPSELIAEQTKILDLPLDEDILIKGAPGSGKTNLLLLRANYLYLGPCPNLHVVVYGSLLKQFIQLGGQQYKFPSEKIVTHTTLFMRILGENGILINTTGMKADESRKALENAMQGLINANKVGQMFDALLVDEAQDYSPEEIQIFRKLTKVFVAAADTRQKIFSVEDSTEMLKQCIRNVHTLKFHFRNGLEICRLADGIMKGKPDHTLMVQHSSYNEAEYPSSVNVKSGLPMSAQAIAIAEQVMAQRVAYPADLIGVLCPRNEEVDYLANYFATTAIADQVTRSHASGFDPARPVWLTTMTSAKGMEFRALHIAGLDFLSKMGDSQRRLAFTGVTRAKTALSLYYESRVPGYLETGIRAVAPMNKPITKLKIFGRE